MMNIKEIRRQNLRTLAREAGGTTRLADRLERSLSQVSHLVGCNPIKKVGDKFAAHVEQSFDKPAGWLDQNHDSMFTFSSFKKPQHDEPMPVFPVLPLSSLPQWKELTREYFAKCTLSDRNKIFAVQVSSGEMAFLINGHFPLGATLMLAPLQSAEVGSLVVVQEKNASNALLGRYEIREQNKYLKPLNDHRPIIELTGDYFIYGVVRQLTANYE